MEGVKSAIAEKVGQCAEEYRRAGEKRVAVEEVYPMNTRHLLLIVLTAILITSACSPRIDKSTISPTATTQLIPGFTEMAEEVLITTEQAMAMAVKTEGALTRATQSTFTPQPTQTSILAHLPTLTPIPNSTPAQQGAFFDVPPDVLGPRYAIENACYFDTQSGWQRYEIYAGAIAGSGDEYSAQGVAIVRIFQVMEEDGNPKIELVDTKEHLTLIRNGPLKLEISGNCSPDWITLATPLNFIWFLHPPEEFYQYEGVPPLARLEAGGTIQIADLGSYCWNNGCLDGPGISTSSIPLPIQSDSTVRLYLPLEESPERLELYAMFISPPGTLQYDHDVRGDRAEWSFEKEGHPLIKITAPPLSREQNITFDLAHGYYVLAVFAAWQDYGDVKYGFLIEVK